MVKENSESHSRQVKQDRCIKIADKMNQLFLVKKTIPINNIISTLKEDYQLVNLSIGKN